VLRVQPHLPRGRQYCVRVQVGRERRHGARSGGPCDRSIRVCACLRFARPCMNTQCAMTRAESSGEASRAASSVAARAASQAEAPAASTLALSLAHHPGRPAGAGGVGGAPSRAGACASGSRGLRAAATVTDTGSRPASRSSGGMCVGDGVRS